MHSVKEISKQRCGQMDCVNVWPNWLKNWDWNQRLKVATVAEALIVAGISAHILGEGMLDKLDIHVWDLNKLLVQTVQITGSLIRKKSVIKVK